MIRWINYIIPIVLSRLCGFYLRFGTDLQHSYSLIRECLTAKDGYPLNTSIASSVIAIEDRRFYEHLGVDFYAIIRAFINNLISRRIQGASTIEQQLVRSLTNERGITYSRKFRECLLASKLHTEFSKDEILQSYCSNYPFDGKTVGIASLCNKEGYEYYSISEHEANELAARFKYPALTEDNIIKYLKRVRTIELLTNNSNKHSLICDDVILSTQKLVLTL